MGFLKTMKDINATDSGNQELTSRKSFWQMRLHDRHPDHGRAGHLIAEAAFYRAFENRNKDEQRERASALAAQICFTLSTGLVP